MSHGVADTDELEGNWNEQVGQPVNSAILDWTGGIRTILGQQAVPGAANQELYW